MESRNRSLNLSICNIRSSSYTVSLSENEKYLIDSEQLDQCLDLKFTGIEKNKRTVLRMVKENGNLILQKGESVFTVLVNRINIFEHSLEENRVWNELTADIFYEIDGFNQYD